MGSRAIDETGNRYGRWVVLERTTNNGSGQTRWLCECDCGVKKAIAAVSLRRGGSRSCGCMPKSNFLPDGVADFNRMVHRWKLSAEKRGLDWQLSREQLLFLTKQPCHYCGGEPAQGINPHGCNGAYIYNGLDRVDNDKGYTLENVVPCCKHCNRAKMTRSYGEFVDWITVVYEHLSVKPQVSLEL